MSNYLAIGGVSKTLKAILEDRMDLPTGLTPADVKVTLQTPKASENGSDPEPDPRVNLFLYNVTENPHLKNQEIPGHGHPGAYGKPPLSLDLHYLLTAYGSTEDEGDTNEALSQQMLGSAMRVFHDFPVITDELVDSDGDSILDSELHDAYERVRLTLSPISLEDLSKVWTALESPYRLSVAYKVNVVQIESKQPRRYPKPVGEPKGEGPRVVTTPFQGPRIEQLLVIREDETQERTVPYARIDDTLVLKGRNLGGLTSRAFIGDVEVLIVQDTMTPERVEITIPDEDALQPGTHAVRIVQDVMLGDPPEPHKGFRSNVAAFVLVPRIDEGGSPTLDTSVWELVIKGSKLYAADLPGETLVGSMRFPKDEYVGPPASTSIRIDLPAHTDWATWIEKCWVSAELAATVDLTDPDPEILVTIGPEGPIVIALPPPPPGESYSLVEAAELLETATRGASESARFQSVSVLVLDSRLHILSVEMPDAVVVEAKPGATEGDPADPTAGELGLVDGDSSAGYAFVSGAITLPASWPESPKVTLTWNEDSHTIELESIGAEATLDDIAGNLESALNDHPDLGITTIVFAIDDRLVLFFDSEPTAVKFGVASSDDVTASALRLASQKFIVRVRVNGAEALEAPEVTLP